MLIQPWGKVTTWRKWITLCPWLGCLEGSTLKNILSLRKLGVSSTMMEPTSCIEPEREVQRRGGYGGSFLRENPKFQGDRGRLRESREGCGKHQCKGGWAGKWDFWAWLGKTMMGVALPGVPAAHTTSGGACYSCYWQQRWLRSHRQPFGTSPDSLTHIDVLNGTLSISS